MRKQLRKTCKAPRKWDLELSLEILCGGREGRCLKNNNSRGYTKVRWQIYVRNSRESRKGPQQKLRPLTISQTL